MASYSESNDIIDGTFAVEIQPDDILTHIRFHYGYNYGKKYYQDISDVQDSTLATLYLKDYAEDLEMDWVREDATAADMAERKLNFRKQLQTHVSFSVPLYGLDDDILSDIEVEHEAGPALGDVTILSMDLNLDSLVVKIKALALPTSASWNILKEDGDKILLENGTDWLRKESAL